MSMLLSKANVGGLRLKNRVVMWLADAAKELHDHDFKVFNASYKRGQK